MYNQPDYDTNKKKPQIRSTNSSKKLGLVACLETCHFSPKSRLDDGTSEKYT